MAEPRRPDVDAFSELGERLRAARAKAGMTRRQLAAASSTSERYLALLEGGSGNPSVSVLTALAAALDLAPAELLPLGGEVSGSLMRAAAAVRRLAPGRLDQLHAWAEGLGGNSEKGRRIVLVGLRGAGKSSLGKALADRLAMPFFEISQSVEEAYGANIGSLIELNGQGALRRYESEAWEALCGAHASAVIAAPGGIVADAPLYERLLETAHSIWLRATPEDHMKRVMAQGDFRPMASNRGAMADLNAILDARAVDYARAEARLDTSAQPFAETLVLLTETARRLIPA